jgi:hypothetical protein
MNYRAKNVVPSPLVEEDDPFKKNISELEKRKVW